MAANPLPRNPLVELPVVMVDASAGGDVYVYRNQIIEWQNHTSNQVPIAVHPNATGEYPLNVNAFSVPKEPAVGPVGTFLTRVLPNAPFTGYLYTNSLAEGGGKIIVTP